MRTGKVSYLLDEDFEVNEGFFEIEEFEQEKRIEEQAIIEAVRAFAEN